MSLSARSTARLALGYVRHVREDARRGFSLRHAAADLARLTARFRPAPPLSSPPHDVRLYETCLAALAADPACRVITLEEHILGRRGAVDGIDVVLRHDVDSGDGRALEGLCRADRRAGFRSSVHVIVDGTIYDPQPLVGLLRTLHDDGFDVGLHTQAWIHPDCGAALRQDLARFEALLGWPARTMTFHGAWPRTEDDLARRKRFEQQLPAWSRQTALVGYNNRFDFVAEDSNVAGQPSPLNQAFLESATRCYLGGVALILTHDTHWRV